MNDNILLLVEIIEKQFDLIHRLIYENEQLREVCDCDDSPYNKEKTELISNYYNI